ncbi:MAG: archease [Bryobacteraceae bacterium]|nr:archease [Bryobacteraceae bacterium]
MFEVVEHTADIGFRASGQTELQMLEEAAKALVSIAVELDDIEPKQHYELEVSGEDAETLLVNWLSEVLYYLDGKRVALCRFAVHEADGGRIKAEAWGEPRDPKKHRTKIVVKGVTWHQLRVWRDDKNWNCQVILDI